MSEIPPMWGATVTHAVHAVWALAARSLARKQLVDMGAHRNVLAVLASLVLANDASLKVRTTSALTARLVVHGVGAGMVSCRLRSPPYIRKRQGRGV